MPSNMEYERAEQYNYKIELEYTPTSGDNIMIDPQQIQYILIDKNFDACNMPVLSLFGSIEKSVLDDMISNMSEATMTLRIIKYDVANNNGGIGEKYFEDKFMFMLDGDLNKTHNFDSEENYEEGQDSQYKEVNLWMLPQMAVNNNRFVQNGVFHGATMNSMILNASNNVGDMLVEPIKYDNSFDQIMVPPTNTISQYMRYLNDNINSFYDTPYRYFMDFDMTYMVSSSGKPVPAKNQTINTIAIEVQDLDTDTNDELGAYTEEKASTYKIFTDTSRIDYAENNLLNKSMNKLTVLDAHGNKVERGIDNTNTSITNTYNQVINTSTNDTNMANSIANSVSADGTIFSMVKNDLDARLFTINKEYVLNDPLHNENNARFLLAQSKQLFIKQGDDFIMSTSLSFRRVNE